MARFVRGKAQGLASLFFSEAMKQQIKSPLRILNAPLSVDRTRPPPERPRYIHDSHLMNHILPTLPLSKPH
jgi:hypothetical protein